MRVQMRLLALALLLGVVSADEAKKPNIVLFLWYAMRCFFFGTSSALRLSRLTPLRCLRAATTRTSRWGAGRR